MRLRKLRIVVLLVALVGAEPARAQPAGDATTGSKGTVTVFAAASLTAAFQSIASAFERSHSPLKVQLNLAGSPTLVQQIQEGAPADVFASADEANMKKLVDSSAVSGTPQLFARNRLQIAVAAGNPTHIVGLADLTKAGLTIALCGPTVPCGRYAAEAFGKAGVSVPAASQEVDVKAVLSKVALGEADAGIVYVTDVRAAGRTVEGVEIPEPVNVVARYPIVALKGAANAAGAQAFIDFVLSAEGQGVLTGFGFMSR